MGSAGGWGFGAPDIEALSSGGFVVSWRSGSTADDSASFRIYDASGSPVTNAISFGGSDPAGDRATKIQELDNGELVTVYQSGDDLFFQRWDSTGTAIGGATAVNATTADTQSQFNIEALSDGSFFIVWRSAGQDGDGDGIYGRHFDAEGNALTGEILINSTTTGNQSDPNIALQADGNLVITWTSDHGTDSDIYSTVLNVSNYQVIENATNGAVVGQVLVNDDDTNLTYTLVDDAGGRFAINSSTCADR